MELLYAPLSLGYFVFLPKTFRHSKTQSLVFIVVFMYRKLGSIFFELANGRVTVEFEDWPSFLHLRYKRRILVLSRKIRASFWCGELR